MRQKRKKKRNLLGHGLTTSFLLLGLLLLLLLLLGRLLLLHPPSPSSSWPPSRGERPRRQRCRYPRIAASISLGSRWLKMKPGIVANQQGRTQCEDNLNLKDLGTWRLESVLTGAFWGLEPLALVFLTP